MGMHCVHCAMCPQLVLSLWLFLVVMVSDSDGQDIRRRFFHEAERTDGGDLPFVGHWRTTATLLLHSCSTQSSAYYEDWLHEHGTSGDVLAERMAAMTVHINSAIRHLGRNLGHAPGTEQE
uniref:Putative secreted protein n=1 Tax=Ixodes ricinus TaxID=34613 RepID=A0A6B0UMY0_IXORI